MSQSRDEDDQGAPPRRAWPPPAVPGHSTAGLSMPARAFRWIATALAVALVISSLAAYLKFRSVWDSIRRVSVADLGPAPPKYANAMNILLIGSDSRSGPNRRFGAGILGQRSDTIIVLHILPDGRGVIVLSIPRDSVVPVLSCPATDGSAGQSAEPGQVEQINATFAFGGPGCLWKTIEQTTHLHLDHFIELNFTGFEKVIDDIGGVSICLPFAINDPLSKLHLSRGLHHVYGAQALAFWRARYIGEGSDLQRIRRDQFLMASVLQGIERKDLMASPGRLISVITDAAMSMTTDTGLNLQTMISIVDSLRRLRPGQAQFIELPTVPYGPDPNWVRWPAADRALFNAIAHDRAVSPAGATNSRPAGHTLAAAATSDVSVRVLDGSGVVGIANAAAAALASDGVRVSGTGSAARSTYELSVIEYPSAADRAAASVIRAILGGAVLQQNRALIPGTVLVIVGAEYLGHRQSAAGAERQPPRPRRSADDLADQYSGITGSANVCHDDAAFAGPRGGA
jgi:LCP family protein required for cell wall assembly